MAETTPAAELSYQVASEQDDEINLLEILTVLKRRWVWVISSFGAVFLGVGLTTVFQTPIFEAKGQVLIKNDNTASALLGLAEQFGGLSPASNQSNPIETELQILLSPPLLETVIQSLNLQDSKGEPLLVEDFEENIRASSLRGTDVIELAYKDPNPERAAAVVNQLMQAYIQYDQEMNRSQTRAAREFIDQQLPRTEGQLKRAQAALKRFKEANQLVAPTQEAEFSLESIAEIEKNIILTRSELLDSQERTAQLRQNLGGISSRSAVKTGKIAGSQRIQSNIKNYESIQDELAAALKIYQPNHPVVIELREKQAALAQNLDSRLAQVSNSPSIPEGDLAGTTEQTTGSEIMTDLVQAEVASQGLSERLRGLAESYELAKGQTEKFPELERQYAELKLNAEIATLTYTNLYESLQKALIAENQNLGKANILHEAPVPKDPISPRIVLNLLMGGILGILLGAGLALIVDHRDLRLRTVQDVRNIYRFTLLGTVPDFATELGSAEVNRASTLFVRDRPRSMMSETYRMINTNLKFSRSDQLQVLVFSSGMAGEGKSSTLANVALAMAELGNRVLLIDADMRLPSQHQVWEIPNRRGLSNVLVDKAHAVEEIPVIAENDYLDILPAGALPPNPITLLDSRRFRQLIKDLRERYEYILIDAPPLTVASDALLISQQTDGLILIARPGTLNRAAANTTLEMVQQSHVKVLGLIANGVIPKNEAHGSYYQQKYYGKQSPDAEEKWIEESETRDPHLPKAERNGTYLVKDRK
ncbi:GumC family protein [Lyngbya confervoides]|uniref:non-specific protein-tyrosine kinase n=1 Tax=Lyngbya confervoides BDU141951 TaxID=1574623 RepID=A0ABD4T3R5_9CYAN|nr:polysaccharide biosynthesis tyrosine autokinase [Lyngbya confervoides]MCM1983123.1 polysaccharide biosynthesis tyrosine autokinase [Lyngbya confervoides BDU141951]